ncbi:bZIP transcription factor 60-like [Macadamia integrifolia]|uniref:bZIP transcription factor 60-like n=1 Tax=Macadamia integrifolia TaxID=60698 RepID=UPI001C500AE5|nr:bZIP transcription factor 60-like [Macadamia integrifolia]
MGDGETQTDEFFSQIETLFENIPNDVSLFMDDLPIVSEPSVNDSVQENSNPSPDSVSSWMDELEELLMKDDTESCVNPEEFCQDFFSDVLDASPDQSCEARVSDEDTSTPEANISDDNEENDKFDDSVGKEGEGDDPMSKKRKRQLRNKDAALRSRERKKIYVRDLELKSKYLEGECRRLGRLLQCYIAENQALHVSLQSKVSGAMTKQESAVLLLESLLLGSLLWFLCIICLFTLPALPHLNLGDPVPKDEGRSNQMQESVLLRAAGNERLDLRMSRLFLKSRRWKATRTKMKADPESHAVLVRMIC